jgi:hypothetical protein
MKCFINVVPIGLDLFFTHIEFMNELLMNPQAMSQNTVAMSKDDF